MIEIYVKEREGLCSLPGRLWCRCKRRTMSVPMPDEEGGEGGKRLELTVKRLVRMAVFMSLRGGGVHVQRRNINAMSGVFEPRKDV